jgi:hypothetical protein
VEEARRLPDVRMFEWFAMRQTRPMVKRGSGEQWVEVDDLRFGFPSDPEHGIWGVRVAFDYTGAVAGAVRRIRRDRPPAGPMARWLWRATFLGDARLHAPPPVAQESTEVKGGEAW